MSTAFLNLLQVCRFFANLILLPVCSLCFSAKLFMEVMPMAELPETALLQYIHKTAERGCEELRNLMDYAGQPSLKQTLTGQLEEYQSLQKRAATLLRRQEQTPAGIGRLTKFSTGLLSAGQMFLNDSPSRIAELTIRGNHAGVCQTLRQLHDYQGEDAAVLELAQRLLRTEEGNIESLKSFL